MENILVAKSYQDLPKVGEVFTSSGRQYINVQLKSGKLKTVRVYSEAEYRKMYPELATLPVGKTYGPQKEILGFDPIMIFIGDIVKNIEFFNQWPAARYHKIWGWYLINNESIDRTLPENVCATPLYWDEVGNTDGYLKSDDEIKKVINQKVRKFFK